MSNREVPNRATLNPKTTHKETLPHDISIIALNAFSDNYIWVIEKVNQQHVVLVDPGSAKVCIDYLENNGKKLAAILLTHHHIDHMGGVEQLLTYSEQHGDKPQVFGPSYQPLTGSENLPIPQKHQVTTDVILNDTSQFTIASLGLTFSVIEVAGHTLEHIAFYSEQFPEPILFCGDALFSGGCGRLFEGSPEQMLHSLTKLSQLPSATRIYCAHEYTLGNLAFARYIEPENTQLINYQQHVQQLRAKHKISLPSTIGLELTINPFLRSQQPGITKQICEHFQLTENTTDTQLFAALRKWKDDF